MWPEEQNFQLDDKFHDECGLFGVWNHVEAANVAYLGLYALQHRGQESAGIAATDGHAFHVEKAMGWGAYTLLLLTPDSIIAVRDPSGFRPMTLGKLEDSWVLASETCALDLMEAKIVRDVEPGEIVLVDDAGLQSFKPFRPQERLQCVFEYVYFARPDSVLWGRNVHVVRKALGHQLAREHPVTADLVIPVPDSGLGAALGFGEEAGLPYDSGLVRNHYVGRTFIEPKQR